jgi:hypothetical protein
LIGRAALVLVALLATATAAAAKSTLQLRADDVSFSANALAIVARGAVTVDGAAVGSGGADAAYVDLRRNTLVLAGRAHLGRTGADALAVDLDDGHVAALNVDAEGASGDFAFPDLDPREVFIRSHAATVTPHANVRFTPAAFPSSVGAVPVPTYLYTFADSSGFAAQSLGGASFDQPYGLYGTPSSLLAVHARYVQGTGVDVAFDHHLVDGNRSYLVTSLDAPLRSTRTFGINGYRRLGERSTIELDGAANAQSFYLHSAQMSALGPFGARLDTTVFAAGGAIADFTLRTPDRPLGLGLTYRLQADLGLQYQRGGVMPQLADASAYQLLWHHGLDLFVATPQFHGPFRTTIGATFDIAHTWFAFPHARNTVSGTATAARRFGPLTATLIYTQSADLEQYGNLQALFFPPPIGTIVTPDGTPWPGYAAYTGASTARQLQFGLQLVTSPSTTYRVTYAHTDDFPQYHGYGRPVDQLALDVRFRLAPNIGIDLGRGYDFAWGGTRWVPTWQFAILP